MHSSFKWWRWGVRWPHHAASLWKGTGRSGLHFSLFPAPGGLSGDWEVDRGPVLVIGTHHLPPLQRVALSAGVGELVKHHP